jgi:hypothetical protein
VIAFMHVLFMCIRLGLGNGDGDGDDLLSFKWSRLSCFDLPLVTPPFLSPFFS